MRGRSSSSSKQGGSSKGGMEVDKVDKLKEEPPHLSGAYIRSLVKQLTSSRTKDPIKDHPLGPADAVHGDGEDHQNITGNTKIGQQGFSENIINQQITQPPPQQQHKKQVRRRLHTSRPYQERLLNMAEARREIVTALKFHRAAMKQANEPSPHTQSQPLQPPPPPPPPQPCLAPESKLKSRRNPRIYASTTSSATNYLSYTPNPNPYSSWSVSPPPPVPENFNLTLPNQTLGLNLNLHDFNNLDTTLYHNPSTYYCSSPSTFTTDQEIPYVGLSQEGPTPSLGGGGGGGGGEEYPGLHQAMDDEEMAEIRSLGEQHQMEWDDTMNLVTSAWWFKFLKTMEVGPKEEEKAAEDDGGYHHPFDQLMEFPANESCCFLQQHLDDHCSDDYLQDPALPCMEIGEIEGLYEEWLA